MRVGQELIDALRNRQNDKITYFLRRVDGRTVNEANAQGYTPLHMACFINHVEAVAQLLAIPGVNVNASTYIGVTPIMQAAAGGSIEAMKMLLQQPAVEVNARDNDGETAAKRAAARCKIEVLRLLCEHPAMDLDIREKCGDGLEDVVGVWDRDGGPAEKSKCLDIIKEARRKRENTSQGQEQASAEEVRTEVIKHNIDQIDNANLKIRERENKIKADEEAKNEKMKVLQKKQDSEQKTITMKLNEEKRIFEEKKNNLEQQLATLQQRHNHEKTILEDNFKKEAENDRQLLASLKITTDQLVRDLGKLDLDLEPENDGAPSAPSAPSTPANIEAAKNTLECPVCLEIMRPPTRIWMCSNSHLVCQECREKIEGRMCPTCRTERVDLRAHMAENFSMSLFNN